MDEKSMLMILRQDLQRTSPGQIPGEDTYLLHLLQAARASLERQGARQEDGEDWYQAVIATAAWMYRKRITGEAEPKYLRRMRLDLIVSQQARGDNSAP